MFEELIELIMQQLTRQPVVTVALSGHGGSGKSTLAGRLGRRFGVRDIQIVRMDSLYAKNYMEQRDLYGLHDWPALIEVLSHIRSSDRLRYRKRNDREIESIVDVERPQVVLVEGIRLIRAELLPYFDISVWIDCPLEFAANRAKERNRQQGDNEEEIALRDTKWIPEARRYMARAAPDKVASFLFTEYR